MLDLLEDFGLVPEEEYLRLRRIKRRRAQYERMHGLGPAYVRFGRQVYYRAAAIKKFLVDSEIRPVRRNRNRKETPDETPPRLAPNARDLVPTP